MYTFTTNWFQYSELKQNIDKFLDVNGINKILEIGSFEGASSCYFSDIFLNSKGSTLVCVDPFNISDSTSPVYQNMRQLFIKNISNSKNWQKIRVRQMISNDFFKKNVNTFNFIYIDGSHLLDDIKSDFNNSLKIIEPAGIIWMDDYASSKDVIDLVDSLYEENKDILTIIHKDYQIAFKVI